MIPIFNDIQKKKADFIITNKHAKLSSLTSSEIKDLAVVLLLWKDRGKHLHICGDRSFTER